MLEPTHQPPHHPTPTHEHPRPPTPHTLDFTSDNTEVYNKPFRLRDLRRSIMKAKPCAPGPEGIHNNLLKHLPEDTLKILKEILNKIWIFLISGEQQRWSRSPKESSNGDPDPQTTRTILTLSVTDSLHWPAVYSRSWSEWLILASSGILKNLGY